MTILPENLAEFLSLADYPEYELRYNIAPTQQVPVLIKDRESGKRVMKIYRWGLIPYWAKDEKIGSRLINAKAETIDKRPSFREAFKKRRCLIPASGFFEWKKDVTGRC